MNTNVDSPGLFLKDSNGNLIKVGPIHVGTTAPNVTPAAGGQAGNSKGEQWLDTSSSRYVFKIWDGTAWRTEDGEFVNASGDTMTGALAIAAGTAALPGLAVSGDPNTGIYAPAADALGIATNGAERVRVTPTGRVGLGITGPAATLHTFETNAGAAVLSAALQNSSTSPGTAVRIAFSANTNSISDQRHAWIGGINTTGGNGTALALATNVDGSPAVERLRLGADGQMSYLGTQFTLSRPGFNVFDYSDNGGHCEAEVFGFSNAGYGGGLVFRMGRGTAAAPASAASGDELGYFGWDGYNQGLNAYRGACKISGSVDGAFGTNGWPGRISFSTNDGTSTGLGSERMRITSAGELLIGYTTDNGAFRLQVNSQIFATSATVATSDGRYKENVATLNGCMSLVSALRPVSFDWKPQQDITRIDEDGNSVLVREGHNFPDGKQIGFIAQEVQEVLADRPWLGSVIKQNVRPAVEDADGNELAPEEEFFGIAEGNLIAVLTAALQEAIAKIDALEARIAALEA